MLILNFGAADSKRWKSQEESAINNLMVAKFDLLTFKVPLERSLQRLRELIVYISEKSEHDQHYGATKLNKILYHSDFRAFERFGVPLTGVSYFRLPKGPAPRLMLPVRNDLIAEGAIRLDKIMLGDGFEHRIVALRRPVLEHFTSDEISLVDEVIMELWPQTATDVSDASHDVRWKILCDKDPIPYEFAFFSNEPPTDDDIRRTFELNKEHNWEK
jgi:hypothetical protein